jgi:hypothetical protein
MGHVGIAGTPRPLANKALPGRAFAFLPIGVLASIASSCARSLGRSRKSGGNFVIIDARPARSAPVVLFVRERGVHPFVCGAREP